MRLYIILGFILINQALMGQVNLDVIYLKNGSILKGKIIEMNPSDDLKFQLNDGSVFVFKMNEIEKMEKVQMPGSSVAPLNNSVDQRAMEQYFENYFTQKRPVLKLLNISKVNGIKKEIMGQRIYEIEYELLMETIQDIYINNTALSSAWSNRFADDFSYTKQPSDPYEAALAGKRVKIEKGERILSKGVVSFEETDNGWRGVDFQNKTFETVGKSYMTPDMKAQYLAEQKKISDAYRARGEWSHKDIDTYIAKDFYLMTNNIPVFENAINNFSIQKKCSECRNDNLKRIAEIYESTLIQTGRYKKVDEHFFNTAVNQNTILIRVDNINFQFIEQDKGAPLNSYTCNITLNLLIRANLSSPQIYNTMLTESILASTTTMKVGGTKEDAFESALQNLKYKLRKFVLKYEPTELIVKSIDVDHKGKAEHITFVMPEYFINENKIEILVTEKSALKIQNNKFVVESKLGNVTYKKKEGTNEIICKLIGNKEKSVFQSFVGRENELIGITLE